MPSSTLVGVTLTDYNQISMIFEECHPSLVVARIYWYELTTAVTEPVLIPPARR